MHKNTRLYTANKVLLQDDPIIILRRKKQTGACKLCTKPERNPMRKLALPDEILLNIEKPARYIGEEVNSVTKNPKEVDIRFAMCFPDV